MTLYEIICGGMGSGKSSYLLPKINPEEAFMLGNGKKIQELLYLRFNSIKKHHQELEKHNIKYKQTTLDKVIEDISNLHYRHLLLDEWSTFSSFTYFWNPEKINEKIDDIFYAIDNNKHIEKTSIITSTAMSAMLIPLSLYKKRALWNKRLFKKADKITKIEFGIPQIIKNNSYYDNDIEIPEFYL